MGDDKFLSLDAAVDVIDSHPDYIRVVTPQGGFTVKDMHAVVRRMMADLKQGRHQSQLIEQFTNKEEQAAARQFLQLFENRRVVTKSEQPSSRDRMVDWIRHSARSQDKPLPAVELLGDGLLLDRLRLRLHDIGFQLGEAATEQNKVLIAGADFEDMKLLRAANAQAMSSQTAFLPVWLDRNKINLGPFVEPGANGCLECLYHRQRAALRRTETDLNLEIEGAGLGASVMGINIAVELTLIEVLRWTFDAHIETDYGVTWTLDLMNFTFSGHSVLRLPRCPACGVNHARHA